MAGSINDTLFNRAKQSIIGGVNSPVRDFGSVDMAPLFIDKAKGPYIYDTEGKEYIDLLMSWGASILGHCDEDVNNAVIEAVNKGSNFGLCHKAEAEFAELIKTAFPSIELLRMVNSGTEAVMSAVRLGRAYTGRDKIIKFEGCYHGHSDGLLTKVGSGLATVSIPASKGVCAESSANTLIAKYNDLESVENHLKKFPNEIACILVEPVAGNMGVIPPQPGFLQGLRDICDKYGALLIFDEVITGFRIALGGAQERFGVKADITTLGKIIGGGFPCGAFSGKKEIMQMLAPLGEVYQAGTLSGNPVAMAAGKTVIEKLIALKPYERLERETSSILKKIESSFRNANINVSIGNVGSMFTIFFTDQQVNDYGSASDTNVQMYGRFFKTMLENGVLLPPSPMESGFVSLSHLDSIVIESLLYKIINSVDNIKTQNLL